MPFAPSTSTEPTSPDPALVAKQQERDAQARQQRFDRAAGNAKQLIDDASSFVKVDPGNPRALDIVQQIADLNASLNVNDPNPIESKTMALSASMQKDPQFKEFETRRVQELKRKNAQYLGDANDLAAKYKKFLIGNVTQYPASANALEFLQRIKNIDAAVSKQDLVSVQNANTEADQAIRAAGLRNDFALLPASPAPKYSSPNATSEDSAVGSMSLASVPMPAASNQPQSKTTANLAATDKNRFLMEGELQDVVMMFNTSASAPHVVKNLRGEIVFEKSRADVCIFQKGSDDALAGIVKSSLAPYALQTVIFRAKWLRP